MLTQLLGSHIYIFFDEEILFDDISTSEMIISCYIRQTELVKPFIKALLPEKH